MLLIQIYYGPINENSSRILRSSNAWLELNPKGKVLLFGINENSDQDVHIQLNDNIDIYNLWVDQRLYTSFPFFGRLRYLRSFRVKLFQLIQSLNIRSSQIIMSNSVSDLPIAVRLQRKIGGKLIYDAHELETERNQLFGIHQLYDRFIEKRFIGKCNTTLVVSEKIKEWYQQKYPNHRIELIRNLPSLSFSENVTNFDRSKYGIPADKTVFIYIGVLNEGRGIEQLLEAFTKLPEHYLLLMGRGRLTKLIQEKANHTKNILFLNPVPSYEVLNFIRNADVGLSLIENTCLSYYYCMPNKVWEYLHAGLPVIVSDFPEMGSFINKYGVGWSVRPIASDIIKLVQDINQQKIELIKKHIGQVELPEWEKEKQGLISLFKTVV